MDSLKQHVVDNNNFSEHKNQFEKMQARLKDSVFSFLFFINNCRDISVVTSYDFLFCGEYLRNEHLLW